MEEVQVAGVTVVPKSGVAWATVTEAEHKKSMGRGGKLNVNIDSMRLVDGEKAALRADQSAKGGGHVGAMTGAIVATSIVFFPAAPLFLFIHGKDITIPKGTPVTAFVNGDVPLDLAKFQSPGTMPAVAAAAVAATATLDISSTPAGAEIELDGSFSGDTPSAITVTPGEHIIRISKAGYKSWERKMKTTSGNIKIAADLEQQSQPPTPQPVAVETPNTPQATPAVSTVQTAVEFWSSPAGAAIEVDGKYLGSTPSTISVSAGQHTIRMRKQDFQPWEKTIDVTPGNLRVAAYMQQVGITLH